MDTRRSVLGGALLVETPCVGSPLHKNPWVEILWWNPLCGTPLQAPCWKPLGGNLLVEPPCLPRSKKDRKSAKRHKNLLILPHGICCTSVMQTWSNPWHAKRDAIERKTRYLHPRTPPLSDKFPPLLKHKDTHDFKPQGARTLGTFLPAWKPSHTPSCLTSSIPKPKTHLLSAHAKCEIWLPLTTLECQLHHYSLRLGPQADRATLFQHHWPCKTPRCDGPHGQKAAAPKSKAK